MTKIPELSGLLETAATDPDNADWAAIRDNIRRLTVQIRRGVISDSVLDDTVQEVLITLMGKLHTLDFSNPHKVSGYVYTTIWTRWTRQIRLLHAGGIGGYTRTDPQSAIPVGDVEWEDVDFRDPAQEVTLFRRTYVELAELLAENEVERDILIAIAEGTPIKDASIKHGLDHRHASYCKLRMVERLRRGLPPELDDELEMARYTFTEDA